MISRGFRRASLIALGVSAALAVNSARAQSADPVPQGDKDDAGEELGVITVTGSRTITENARSPTPITSIDIAEVMMTTPSDTAVATPTG